MTLGELVRRAREARGWTQTDLARESGLRQTYISQVEGGDIALPREHNLDKLGQALGLSRADFYGAAGMLEGMTPEAPARPTPPPDTLWPDSPHLTVAQMVEDIERRKGAWYQAELDEARQELSRDEYETFCVDLWRMFEGNSKMAFGNRKRGR
jgi:transcriptional regulator with XRE-family HTH domain